MSNVSHVASSCLVIAARASTGLQWCIYGGTFKVQALPTMSLNPSFSTTTTYHHGQLQSRVGKVRGFLKTICWLLHGAPMPHLDMPLLFGVLGRLGDARTFLELLWGGGVAMHKVHSVPRATSLPTSLSHCSPTYLFHLSTPLPISSLTIQCLTALPTLPLTCLLICLSAHCCLPPTTVTTHVSVRLAAHSACLPALGSPCKACALGNHLSHLYAVPTQLDESLRPKEPCPLNDVSQSLTTLLQLAGTASDILLGVNPQCFCLFLHFRFLCKPEAFLRFVERAILSFHGHNFQI